MEANQQAPSAPSAASALSNQGLSNEALMIQLRREERARRELAERTCEDMQRLLRAWRDNSLTQATTITSGTASQPLTITLKDAQIDAIVREYFRLKSLERTVRFAAHDPLYTESDNGMQAGGTATGAVTQRPF